MFNFFKKKGGKTDAKLADSVRNQTNHDPRGVLSVGARASRNDNDVTNEKSTNTLQKDVVNLLLPETDYSHKTGVGALLQIIGGKRKGKKKMSTRADSVRVSPPKDLKSGSLQRSKSERDTRRLDDVRAPTPDQNTRVAAHTQTQMRDATDPADFVKALVLQKYANKAPDKNHVSHVYVSDPALDEKRHAEALLREIARSIDCTIDKIIESQVTEPSNGIKDNTHTKHQMGTTDSKEKPKDEHVYETIADAKDNNDSIEAYKKSLKLELDKVAQETRQDNIDTSSLESPSILKKSNLKPPRSDTEGCSDDDRSDCSKKRVIFNKHLFFDDGDRQTDDEIDSSFESLTSEEEEDEYLEDTLPDNDEHLGGYIVSRCDENKTIINLEPKNHLVEIVEITDESDECEFDNAVEYHSVVEVCDENPNIKTDFDIKLHSSVEITEHKETNDFTTVEITDNKDNNDFSENDILNRVFSDNTDSGFVDSDQEQEPDKQDSSAVKTIVEESESESETEVTVTESDTEEVTEEDEEQEEIELIEEEPKYYDDSKSLVSQESKFQNQVAALTELADTRCGEVEKARELIAEYRKEIEARDLQIEQLKCELASAYKEAEMVRQRSKSLEDDLCAARRCSADLAEQLHRRNDDAIRQLRAELEDAQASRAELESRVVALLRDKEDLEREKVLQEQRAEEALTAAEASTAKWRAAHESARSQAAARAERMLADCEWKMRELELRAREADREKRQLKDTIASLQSAPQPTAAQMAELQQLRGVVSEQQRSVQSLALQLQKVETREEALKLEIHRLKELLEKETRIGREKEERHFKTIERLEQQHSKSIETLKSEHATQVATSRANLERAHGERTRNALSQLRAEAEHDAKNADRKLREVTTRFENLKEVLASKESQFERAIAEARSKADWDIMQLRHLLDKTDIQYANKIEQMNERFEQERDRLTLEWTEKLRTVEEEAATAAEDARKLLDTTKMKLIAEKNDLLNKLKEQHRREMDEQWERFMSDKETCLARMKSECRQEGEEDRVQREKELIEEIAELKSIIQSKSVDYESLTTKAAACGRTLDVTEQELKEALARERELREKRADDHTKIRQLERANKDEVEHLQRKCACLRKLFDDIRARLAAREREYEKDSRGKEREIHQLRAEVARLTKLLVEQSPQTLGARTRADGCETALQTTEKTDGKKGGRRTPEAYRKRPTLPDLAALPPSTMKMQLESQNGRRRSNSVDLPAVQVPVRIKQIQEKTERNSNAH